MPGLRVHEIGHLELRVDGFDALPISRLRYTMAINEIPKVALVVDGGFSVLTGDRYEPERLLERLNDNSQTSLLECEIVEYSNSGAGQEDKVVFKGYLVDGGASYGSGTAGDAEIAFTCLGYACALKSNPGSLYIESPLGSVVGAVLDQNKNIDLAAALQSNNYLYGLNAGLADVYGKLDGLDLVSRLAIIVSAVRSAISTVAFDSFKKKLGKDIMSCRDAGVLRAFGGGWRLREDKLREEVLTGFSESLTGKFMNTVSGGSVYDTIVTCLTSPYFVLDLVPRWSCDKNNDFKTEIKPVTVWAGWGASPIELVAGDVVSFYTRRDALAAVNTPDVVIAWFPDGAADVGDRPVELRGVRGAAAKSEILNTAFRSWAETKGKELSADMTQQCRVVQFTMPDWCNALPYGLNSVDKLVSMQGLANDMALAMLQYHYRKYDEAVISLDPGLRFGHGGKWRLEDRLGDRVHVDLSDGSAERVKRMRCWGCLQSLTYDYSVQGGSARASYTAVLTRVMYGDADAGMLGIECPLYKKG